MGLLSSKNGQLHKWLIIALSLSLLLNVFILLPYVNFYGSKIADKLLSFISVRHFTDDYPDEVVLDKVCEATVGLDGIKMSMDESRGLLRDLKTFYTSPSRGSDIPNNFYTSYAMVGVSYYAIAKNDSLTMEQLRRKFKKYIDKSGVNYEIQVIDQASIGILLLNLYTWFHDEIYLKAAHELFADIQSMRENDGSIKYRPNSPNQFCDAVGMYIPFLMEYFNLTKDSLAYQIADYNMQQYYRKGVDKETGIPFHGYDWNSGIRVGSANWGRGIGWYLLAAAYCPQFKDEKLNESLKKMNYTQFPNSNNKFDSSTALMFEIYKQAKNPNRPLSLSFIKPHILKMGFVDDCSGDTYNLNDYSHSFGESELCNGLLLMLASKFSNANNSVH